MIKSLERQYRNDIIVHLRKCLGLILYISIILEILFFPSWANVCGCIMSFIVYSIFCSLFLKRWIIVEHPFSFFCYMSMFLARYIPLPATLIEGHPITLGFEVPYQTFFHETLMFIVSSAAFYLSIRLTNKRNNIIQESLCKLNFFRTNEYTLWIMGGIGLLMRIQQLSVAGNVEYGDIGNKFFAGLTYLQYAPIIMLFPSLTGLIYNKRRNIFVWIYIVSIFIISFASNSRQEMIYPAFTIILLLFISCLLKKRFQLFHVLTPLKFILLCLILVLGIHLFSYVSLAMLANRDIRDNVTRDELFLSTIETLQDEQQMEQLKEISIKKNTITPYREGWTEIYLDNFMLNRYGNLRVSDETLYYAGKIGYGNKDFRTIFFAKVATIFPTPLLNWLGIAIDKSKMEYSSGDMLYLLGSKTKRFALGGYRVTSLVADGLAIFGYYCYPIIFILLFLSFKLMDNFVIYKDNQIVYSTFALINIFGFLGMFRNSIGCINIVTYLLRGFWQQCFTFGLVLFFIGLFFTLKKVWRNM